MQYFRFNFLINSQTGLGGDDYFSITGFHPRWKDAASKFCESQQRIKNIQDLANLVGNRMGVPMQLDFAFDVGLKFIRITGDRGLTLITEQGMYQTNNISSVSQIAAMNMIMVEYIQCLRDYVEIIEEEEEGNR